MKNVVYKHSYVPVIITLMILTVLSVPISVGAQNTDAGNGQAGASETSGSSTASQKRLQGRSLSKCQNREMAINNVMNRIGDRGEKQIAVIQSIEQKVQAFYIDKNISIANYDSLMTNVQVKKQTATMSMDNIRTMNNSFGCSGEDPKGVATQFKTQAAAQSDSITEYKNAVHELVVEIKTAVGDAAAVEEN